ncbi:hypothetical protein M3Y97_00561300 [Aphelenchoides bicaudatus]|nr:hypothetical protein M3Y97_00561300 [Aphelenchoides bicaudatus]
MPTNSNNELDDEAERLRRVLLEQMKNRSTGSPAKHLISSSILNNKLDLNESHLEDAEVLESDSSDESFEDQDITCLFARQQSAQAKYQQLKANIAEAKKNLANLENDLEEKINLGVEINETIKSHLERYFVADFKRLGKMDEVQNKLRTTLNQRTTRAKQRIKELKQNSALIEPRIEPKIIPLSPVRSLSPAPIQQEKQVEQFSKAEANKEEQHSRPASSLRESKSHSMAESSSDKKHRHSKSNSSKHSSKKERKKSKKRSSKEKRLDKLAEKLNISQLVGNGKSSNEAEAELLKRMLERSKRKHRSHSKERSEKRRRKRSKSREDPKPSSSKVDDSEFVEDPVQPSLYATTQIASNFATPSQFVPQVPVQHPIMSVSSFSVPPPAFTYAVPQTVPLQNVYPSYAYSSPMIHPQFSTPSTSQYTISTTQEVQDRDMRTSDHDIIRMILNSYPRLCPPNVSPDELASKLLETSSVDYVAKMLLKGIPEFIKEQCFSLELKQFISSLESGK